MRRANAPTGSELDTPESHNTELLKNSYVIIGHCFDITIVWLALGDVLLNDLVATTASLSDGTTACSKINRFADALILLILAIKAYKVVLLKEAAERCQINDSQPPLMHILSTAKINPGCVNSSRGEFGCTQSFNRQIDNYDCGQPC